MKKFNNQLILILESIKVFVLLYLIGYILNGFENFFNPVSWGWFSRLFFFQLPLIGMLCFIFGFMRFIFKIKVKKSDKKQD